MKKKERSPKCEDMGVEEKREVSRGPSIKRGSVDVGRGSISLEAAAAGVVDVDAKATIYV